MWSIKNFWKTSSPLKRRAIVLIGVSFVAGFFISRRPPPPVAPLAVSWREFIAASPEFRIAMPLPPRHFIQDTTLPSLGTTITKGIFTSEDDGGRIYTLAVATYPSHTPPLAIDKIVKAELQALFQNTSDYRVDITASENGADFSAVRFDGGPSVKGKIVVYGQEVYVLSFSALLSPVSDQFYQKFVNSFTL